MLVSLLLFFYLADVKYVLCVISFNRDDGRASLRNHLVYHIYNFNSIREMFKYFIVLDVQKSVGKNI